MILVFTSCEDEQLLTIESPYKELIVVRSEIVPNNYFSDVKLTKTLPLGITYNINLAEIVDATMYLKINNVKVVPLHYTSDGLYKTTHELYVNPGDYYELFGEIGKRTFYARTKIPLPPNIENVFYNPDEYFSGTVVHVEQDECYSALWVINDGSIKTPDDFFDVFLPENISIGSTISVRTAAYPSEYHSSIYTGKRYIQVYAFDASFEKYFKTKAGNQVISNPYVQDTGNTEWNVKGENTIGMFIGVVKSNIVFVN